MFTTCPEERHGKGTTYCSADWGRAGDAQTPGVMLPSRQCAVGLAEARNAASA